MEKKKELVGRSRELDEFKGFVDGNRTNWGGVRKNAPILLVVGDEGMGKTALLQAMAQYGAELGHHVELESIYKDYIELHDQFTFMISRMMSGIKFQTRDHVGPGRYWVWLTLTGLAAASGLYYNDAGGFQSTAISSLPVLGEIFASVSSKIQKIGRIPGCVEGLFLECFEKIRKRLPQGKKIVIFLDPEKETPHLLLPFIRRLFVDHRIPDDVRFVISQRSYDILIKGLEEQNQLAYLFAEPLYIHTLSKMDTYEFISRIDTNNVLDNVTKEKLISKYQGWPQALEIVIGLLNILPRKRWDKAIERLPPEIKGLWEEWIRQIGNDKEALTLLYISCLLPHPYEKELVGKFSGLSPSEVDAGWNNRALWRLLVETMYPDPNTGILRCNCPYPKHSTVIECVINRLNKQKMLLKKHVVSILRVYGDEIGHDPTRNDIDKDALVYLPKIGGNCKGLDEEYLQLIGYIFPIKNRYGLYSSCLDDLEYAVQLAKNASNTGWLAPFISHIALVYRNIGHWNEAIRYGENALARSRKLGDLLNVSIELTHLSVVYRKKGDVYKAENYQREAINYISQLYEKENELEQRKTLDKYRAEAYSGLGLIYHHQCNYRLAEEMYTIALNISENLGDSMVSSKQYLNLADIKRNNGEFDKAEEMYLKALSLQEKIGHEPGMADTYSNLGIIYMGQSKLDKAMNMLMKSKEIEERILRKDALASLLGNIGILFLHNKNHSKAKEFFIKSINISEKNGFKELSANQYANLGGLCAAEGNVTDALMYIEKAIEIYNALGMPHKAQKWQSFIRKPKS